MLGLVVAHLALACLLPALSARRPRVASAVAAVPPAVALLWALAHAREALDGGVSTSLRWAPELGLTLSFRLPTRCPWRWCVLVVGCRRPRPALLRAGYFTRRRRRWPLRRGAAGLRRGDARARPRRRPDRALRLLGADDGLLATCSSGTTGEREANRARRAPGAHRHHPRRPRDARRASCPRHAAGTLPDLASRRRPARRRRRRRRRRADPARGADQVGALAVPPLAAGRHGRAHPGQRLSARRGHGQGRRLPGRAARARLRRRARLAARRARPRRCARCCSAAGARCASTTSNSSSPTARSASSASSSCSSAPAPGTPRSPAPRCSSPTPCSRRRCSSSPASSTTRRAPATCADSPASADALPPLRGGRRARRRVHGRTAAAARIRRQGGRVRGVRTATPGPLGAGHHGGRGSVLHRRLHRALPLGRLRPQAGRRGHPGAPARPAAHRPPAICAVAGLVLGDRRPGRRRGARSYADDLPGRRSSYHLALWHGLGLPLLLSAVAHRARVRAAPRRGRRSAARAATCRAR